MNKIIADLKKNDSHIKIYLIHIYNLLGGLTEYRKGFYEGSFQGLYQDFYFLDLMNNSWGEPYISEKTRKHCRRFHNKWKNYVYTNSYSLSFWVYCDDKWHDIIKNELLPLLKSMDADLTLHNVNANISNGHTLERIKHDFTLNTIPRPSDEDILENINILYKLLIDNAILEKPYMEGVQH